METSKHSHNWDDYYGYRRLVHGNLHGDAVYKKTFSIKQSKTGKRFFLFFEGVGSYATVTLNGKLLVLMLADERLLPWMLLMQSKPTEQKMNW
jgi:hypothetical protein